MNTQVVRRKEASAGIVRPLITYARLSFLPLAKESSNLKERGARGSASDSASAAPSDLPPCRAQQSGPGRHATSLSVIRVFGTGLPLN